MNLFIINTFIIFISVWTIQCASIKRIEKNLFNYHGANYMLTDDGLEENTREEINNIMDNSHEKNKHPVKIISTGNNYKDKLFNNKKSDKTVTKKLEYNTATNYEIYRDKLYEVMKNGTLRKTPSIAMGYSFAAGTTDGPGAFDFTQGTTTSNPLWNAVRDFIAEPTDEDILCHAPKPILLATGRAKFPYEWQPKTVSCSVARIGGFFLAAVPGEFTTMSGRRLRRVVTNTTGEAKRVVLAGLSNVYSDYIATPEEYQAQRYEAASTIFGPHTLDIYLNKYIELTEVLISGKTLDPGPDPPDFSNQLITLVPPVLWDSAPWGKEFGDCVQQPQKHYSWGDIVSASFVSGHPRNSIRHGRWYGAVDKLESEEDDAWAVVATDADWETKYIWHRDSKVLGTSHAEIEWEIPEGTPPGTYRIHHYGNYKYVLGGIYPYSGFSDSFEVT